MKTIQTTALLIGLTATPALAIDTCLVGLWQADADDIAHLMSVQMNGTAEHVSGRVSMEITDTAALTLRAEDLVINVALPGVHAMDVTVTGYSQGSILAEDGTSFEVVVPQYALVGSAMVLGSRMEIPFTSSTGMMGNATGSYACSGNGASFDTTRPGSMPRQWRRIR